MMNSIDFIYGSKPYKVAEPGFLGAIVGEPGVGKCQGKGTLIYMYDGSLKKVEDIVVGDKLMGIDSTPRVVLSLARGRDQMYWVRQSRGIDYRVNSQHMLSLQKIDSVKYKRKTLDNGKRVYDKDKKLKPWTKETLNIPIEDFLSMEISEGYKQKKYRGYRQGVLHFNNNLQKLKIDPYFLGLWLGDGTRSKPQITNGDKEVISFLKNWGRENGFYVKDWDSRENCKQLNFVTDRGKTNPLTNFLRYYGIYSEKNIPIDYLLSTYENRLQILAGLLDTDGYLDPRGNIGYEITQKSFILSSSIVKLARSLGFTVEIKDKVGTIKAIGFKGNYYRIYITGEVWKIPCKVKRKVSKYFKRRVDHSLSSITIEKDVIDDYYGFELSGDKLYMLEDQTVTHNSSLTEPIASSGLRGEVVAGWDVRLDNKKVCVIDTESPESIERRYKTKIKNNSGLNLTDFNNQFKYFNLSSIMSFEERVEEIGKIYKDKYDLIMVDNLTGLCDPLDREGATYMFNMSSKKAIEEGSIVIALNHLNQKGTSRGWLGKKFAEQGSFGFSLEINNQWGYTLVYPEKTRLGRLPVWDFSIINDNLVLGPVIPFPI